MIFIEPLPKFFRIQSVTDTSVAMIILGAFAYVPATAIIYLLNERTRKEKRLQYICGSGNIFVLADFSSVGYGYYFYCAKQHTIQIHSLHLSQII